MKLIDKYGTWACIAGAGEGLGYAFSKELAKQGFNLILIDQKLELLINSKEKLTNRYQCEIDALHLDLNEKKSVIPIMERMQKHQCRFLIYNAAYGPVKPFLSNTLTEIDRYLNVNMTTQIHLIQQFIKNQNDRAKGILMVSSLAGWRGTQLVIPYAATKAFIWNMAEGLHYEFKNSNLDISVCCPGPTETPGFQSTNPRLTFFSPKPRNPELVAKETLKKFGKKLFIVPGSLNKISHFILNRILPRKIASGIHNAAMKKIYE